jgi:hypothetical protein
MQDWHIEKGWTIYAANDSARNKLKASAKGPFCIKLRSVGEGPTWNYVFDGPQLQGHLSHKGTTQTAFFPYALGDISSSPNAYLEYALSNKERLSRIDSIRLEGVILESDSKGRVHHKLTLYQVLRENVSDDYLVAVFSPPEGQPQINGNGVGVGHTR